MEITQSCRTKYGKGDSPSELLLSHMSGILLGEIRNQLILAVSFLNVGGNRLVKVCLHSENVEGRWG